MAAPNPQSFSQFSSDLLADTCQQLSESLHAQELWVGLPDSLHRHVQFPVTRPLSSLLKRLTGEDKQQPDQDPGIQASKIQRGQVISDSEAALFWALVPIPFESYSPGAMVIIREQPFLDQDDQLEQVVAKFIPLLVIAVENVLLKKTASQYRSSMEALQTVSLRMASTLQLQDILNLLVESVLQLLPANSAHIYIYRPEEEEGGGFTFEAAQWRQGKDETQDKPRPDDLAPLVAQRKWPLIIDQAKDHPLYEQLIAAKWDVASMAAYPLKRGGRLLGVLIASFIKPYTLTGEERHLLSLFADQAAAAINNAQIAHNLSDRLIEMTTLHQLAQKTSATLDVDEVMQTTVEALKSLFNAFALSIMLLDENQVLKLAATVLAGTVDADEAYFRSAYLEPGQGIGGRVVLSGESIYVPDVRQDEHYKVINPHIRSLLCVPLIVKRRVIGTLSIASEQVDAFNRNAERLLAIAAAQTAIAIENARLYQSEHRQAQELKTISELSRLITQHLEIEQVFTAAHQAIQQLMSCEAFVIAMVDNQTREISAAYLIDRGVRYPPTRWLVDTDLPGYVIENNAPILVGDIQSDSFPFGLIHFGEKGQIRSLIAAPLRFGREVIGMVSTQSYQPDEFNENDLQLLQDIANNIAIALEHANLYANLQKRYLRLQELDRARLEFTQNVTHELRTPLTFMKAYVDLLLEGGLGDLNVKQRQSLGVVQSKTMILVHLIEDITTLETRGRDWLLIQDIDLLKLTRNALLINKDAADRKQVSIHLEAESSLPTVQADPDRINQVLDNLLSNAIQYSYPDSEIIVHLQVKNGQILASISNQGDIITGRDQVHLFESFYQVDQYHKGIGLGLAIVKHVIEAHGGKVWVESEEGKGTTFFFTLPYNQPRNRKEIAR